MESKDTCYETTQLFNGCEVFFDVVIYLKYQKLNQCY